MIFSCIFSGTFAPRLDISLKKIPRPSNLHTTYLSRYSRRWYSQKKFKPEVFFFEFTNFYIHHFFLEVCKLGKKYFRFEFFCCEYHRIEYRDRYVVCKFEGRGIFLSEISSRVPTGSIFSNLQTSKKKVYLQVCKFEKKILPFGKYFDCE